MESIGDILKCEREKRNLSLQEVYEVTRITPHNLSALEEDRFHYFPNRVYARAFLRDYANFLALDSVALLSRYEEICSPEPKPSTTLPVSISGRTVSPAWWIAIALLGAILLGSGGYYLWGTMPAERYAEVSEEPNYVPPTDFTGGTSPTDTATNVTEPPKTVPNGVQNAERPPMVPPESPAPSAAPPTEIVVAVTASGIVWVRAYVDGAASSRYMGLISAGQRKEWRAKKKVSLRVGRPNAIQVTVNGIPQTMGQGSSPAEKTFELKDFVPKTNERDTLQP